MFVSGLLLQIADIGGGRFSPVLKQGIDLVRGDGFALADTLCRLALAPYFFVPYSFMPRGVPELNRYSKFAYHSYY